jgi:pilus assembly protein Flp/PilA
MTKLMARFIREEAGQDLIEYGLLAGIITLGAIVAIQGIGTTVTEYFNEINTRIAPPAAPAP